MTVVLEGILCAVSAFWSVKLLHRLWNTCLGPVRPDGVNVKAILSRAGVSVLSPPDAFPHDAARALVFMEYEMFTVEAFSVSAPGILLFAVFRFGHPAVGAVMIAVYGVLAMAALAVFFKGRELRDAIIDPELRSKLRL